MAETLIMTKTVVHIPEAKWAGAMNFYRHELGEPDKVVPKGAPLQDAREVEWGSLRFIRGGHDFATKGAREVFVRCGNPKAVANGLRDLLQWTGGSVYDPVRELRVHGPGHGTKGALEFKTITLASVAVPGRVVTKMKMAHEPDPQEDASAEGDGNEAHAASKQSKDDEPEELKDEAFERSTAAEVVLGVIHNPNF